MSASCIRARLSAVPALVALLLCCGVAGAGEEELGALGPEAAAVLEAHEAGDREALRRQVQNPEADAWSVAHELLVHGHLTAARALARSTRGRALEPLADYVATLSRRPPSKALWARRQRLAAMADEEHWFDLLEDLEHAPVDASESSVAAVDIQYVRGLALAHLDRPADGMRLLMEVGERARALGWWKGAEKALEGGFATAQASVDVPRMRDFLQRLHALHEQSGDRRAAAYALANLGSVLGNASQFRDAVLQYKRVLADYHDVVTRELQLHVYASLGMAYQNLGRYAEAQSWGHRALYEARRPKGGSRQIEALANESLGMLASAIGEYAEARAYLDAAREIVSDLGDASWLVEIDGNIGTVHMYCGEYDEALAIMRRLVDYYDQYDKPLYRVVAKSNIAEIRRRQGKLDLALRRMQSTRKEAEQLANEERLQSVYGELAVIHRRRGEDQQALNYEQKALALARKTGAIDAEVAGLAELAAIRLLRKEHALALQAARRASEMLSFLFDRLPPDQAASARRRTAAVYANGLRAALALGDVPAACYFIEGGRAGALLTQLQGRSLVRSAKVDPVLLQEEVQARRLEAAAQRAYRALQGGGVLAEVRRARRTYERARQHHKQAVDRILLEASIAADLMHPEPAEPQELAAALDPDEALVLYERVGSRLVALVLTREEPGRLVMLGEADAVHAQCERLQFGPERRDAPAEPGKLQALLAAPLGLRDTIRRVLISPVGCLSYQSAALLFPGRESAFVPSATTYVRLRTVKHAEAGPVLALGDPVYGAPPAGWSRTSAVRGGKLTALPGTRAEATAVGDTVLLGPEATETRLRQVLAGDKRWRCVHLACHGLVNEERPSYSALALTPSAEDDGLLTAFDVSQLDIRADLVVLSACETARGKMAEAEGIRGLTRAFMAAGARRVLVSLWKVDDEASRELMIQFHKLWNAEDPEQRTNAAAALRAAQAHVRDYARNHGGQHPEWAHPHYWAAWQLWGPAD